MSNTKTGSLPVMEAEILDIRTVAITMSLVVSVCTVLIFLLWLRSRKRFDGTGYILADFCCQSAGIILISLRSIINDWISIVLASTLTVLGTVLGLTGFQRFFRKKINNYYNYILVGIFPFIHAYFTFVVPDINIRTLNSSVFFLIIFAQYVWLFKKKLENSMKRSAHFLGTVFSLFMVLNLSRLISFFILPKTSEDYMHSGTLQALFLLSQMLLLILLTFGTGLLINNCLFTELMAQEEKYSKAFKSSPFALILSRLSDGLMVEVNRGFENMTGYTAREIIGKKSTEMHLWAEIEKRHSIVNKIDSNGEIKDEEIVLIKKNGELLYGNFSAQTIMLDGEKYMLSCIADITHRKKSEQEREELISKLQKALSEIKTLSGLLPICSECKKIRDKNGKWQQIESYIARHSNTEFSHGICPECMKKLYPDMV